MIPVLACLILSIRLALEAILRSSIQKLVEKAIDGESVSGIIIYFTSVNILTDILAIASLLFVLLKRH